MAGLFHDAAGEDEPALAGPVDHGARQKNPKPLDECLQHPGQDSGRCAATSSSFMPN